MKRFWIAAALMAALTSATAIQPVNADEEVKGPVPTRADANNPNTEVYRASDIMNLPVKNDDGAEVGRIKDLVINGESREVLYAVVSLDDAKEKDALYVMPWTVFQPNYGARNALQYTVLTLPPTVWRQAPFYSAAQWRQVAFSEWGPRVNNYYANHIHQGAGNRSTNVKVSKPPINDEDINKPNAPKQTDKNTNEKPGRDKEPPKPQPQPQPAPKLQPQPQQPQPQPLPNTPGRVQPPAPNAPKAPGVKEVEPPAPKNPLPAPNPRDPKVPAPK